MVAVKTRDPAMWSGVLAIAAALAAASISPAGAQIAHPMQTQATLPAAPPTTIPTAPPATAPAAAAPSIDVPTNTSSAPQQMLYYVCGNSGMESHVTSPDPQHPFNLGVMFVSSADSGPLNQVAVKLRRHGRVLMDFVAAGPYCLFAVPDADYRIEGTYRGEMKFEIVQTGNLNAQIKW
ncbi:hypothetical protein [Paraburkholderia bannensis]|uniref:hypothetical protein n=1 Tax=Paraburkholderia bannensis TaxID=765414 RepID=UPI002ABD8596|nr:hypothetical protein [Paraburkholderia bannensis]